ncbi:SphA family protein [Flaviflagellibacter deserti]|uniref:Transporter n=1 Tax=Flaviflagellibacter deserti TaxID=2267266 RepID=A0ABV9YZM8_9HYPH
MRNVHAALTLTAALAAVAPHPAEATEGAAGRYMPGLYAQPGAGIVPPFPGAYWGVSNIVYSGSANFNIPIGDNIAAGVDATVWTTALGGVFVPKLELGGNWTYAVSMVLPFGRMETAAFVGPFERTDVLGGLGDIQITPLLFGWHNDTGNTFFSAGLTVTAPTGNYDPDKIAFVGMNYWSFTPYVAATHIDAAHGIDYSAKFGIDFNTTNPDTDYYSGAMAHLDVAITKSLTERFSAGIFTGVLYQIEDDDSTFADLVGGFKGRSVAVGPVLKYKAKIDDAEVDFSFSWAPEVHVENRLKGDAFYFNMSGKF